MAPVLPAFTCALDSLVPDFSNILHDKQRLCTSWKQIDIQSVVPCHASSNINRGTTFIAIS
jgi:hypothetical protein